MSELSTPVLDPLGEDIQTNLDILVEKNEEREQFIDGTEILKKPIAFLHAPERKDRPEQLIGLFAMLESHVAASRNCKYDVYDIITLKYESQLRSSRRIPRA